MDKRIFPTFPSFIASLVLYFGLVFSLFFIEQKTQDEAKKYTNSKDNFIDVFVEIKQSQSTENSAKFDEFEAQKTTNKNISQSEISSENSLQNLFSEINKANLDKAIQSRQKSAKETTTNKSAKDIVNSLELQKQKASQTQQNSGIYDEYYGQITQILQDYWLTHKAQSDNNATVQITILGNGKFSFKIVELSQDFAFNKKVRKFLDSIANITFPPSPREKSVINVNLQDKTEKK